MDIHIGYDIYQKEKFEDEVATWRRSMRISRRIEAANVEGGGSAKMRGKTIKFEDMPLRRNAGPLRFS